MSLIATNVVMIEAEQSGRSVAQLSGGLLQEETELIRRLIGFQDAAGGFEVFPLSGPSRPVTRFVELALTVFKDHWHDRASPQLLTEVEQSIAKCQQFTQQAPCDGCFEHLGRSDQVLHHDDLALMLGTAALAGDQEPTRGQHGQNRGRGKRRTVSVSAPSADPRPPETLPAFLGLRQTRRRILQHLRPGETLRGLVAFPG